MSVRATKIHIIYSIDSPKKANIRFYCKQVLSLTIIFPVKRPKYQNFHSLYQAVHVKAMAIGTTFAFMMAVIGLSLHEIIILKKVIKIKLIAIFVGIMFLVITMTGYLLMQYWYNQKRNGHVHSNNSFALPTVNSVY